MSLISIFILAVGLSMDAFAVAACKGLAMREITPVKCAVVGLWFGGFQALMPTLGYFFGTALSSYIAAVDHWIALALLAFIGGKMIWEAVRGGEENISGALGFREMLVLAVATSIDALAAGVSLACIGAGIARAALLIGLTTFTLSAVGVRFGAMIGKKCSTAAEFTGGVILILLGVKTVIEHLA